MHYNQQHTYDMCKNHMHAYVLVEVNDGTQVDGIITGLDNDYVYMAVPIGQEPAYDSNWRPNEFDGFGYGYSGYGYGGYPGYGYPGPGYGGSPGYGYGGNYRPRRFRRLVLPLAALTALSVLPWY
ncbi:hypothetical protein GCM10008983_07200 [Lentibacillus halophilus]|uniref:Uncharacterized protein n=1 Tax=Lentibacillus halophilus TaxID=295065 RepID=A0ABP3IYD8_9BACI